MAQFHKEKVEMFLGVVRKYMQLRGGLSQKDLSDITEVGVSTMSRFLNQKTADINPQLVAKIIAKLDIPLNEVIDFVDEEFEVRFKRLVKFYKNEGEEPQMRIDDDLTTEEIQQMRSGEDVDSNMDELAQAMSPSGEAKMSARGNVGVGNKKRTLVFEPDTNSNNKMKEKFDSMTKGQKIFLNDFLNLDMDRRNLIVDVSKSLIQYFKEKDMEF